MRGTERGPFERLSRMLHATLFAVIATTWTLSSVHAVARWPLVIAGASIAGFAIFRVVRSTSGHLNEKLPSWPGMPAWLWAIVLLPLGAWLAYSTFRGLVIPIGSHDALSYHLPRAVEIVRARAWHLLDVEDFRLRSFPSDYELLLADVLALGGGEPGVHFVSIAIFICTLATILGFVERHWGRTPLPILAALVWAGTPLALLHTAAVKNDLLSATFALGAALWGGCALASLRDGALDRDAAALCVLDLALGLGTKSTGIFPLAALVLVALSQSSFRTFVRRTARRPRTVVLAVLGGVVLALVTGAIPYVAQLVLPAPPDTHDAWTLNITPRWGELSHLVVFPYLLFARPFSSSELAVWLPWRGQFWFWPKYEIYFSSFGILVTLLLALVPIAWYLGAKSPEPRRTERSFARAILLLSTVLLVPLHYRTEGFFNGFPRYVMFVPVLVVDAGLLPLLQRARDRSSQASSSHPWWAAQLAVAAAAVVFAFAAVDAGRHDRFAPFDYVMFAASHPGTRASAFVTPRAAPFVDSVAGPNDVVAIDDGFGAWVYPAYGAALTRPVIFLSRDASERARQIDSADWVVVDRAWPIVWGSPALHDMGDFFRETDHGTPTESDLRTATELRRDPRFEIAFDEPRYGQLVFRRRR